MKSNIGRKNRSSAKKRAIRFEVLAGCLAGVINGLFGGGGGMIIVPCLKYLLKFETASAHATAIAVILPISVLSGVFYTAFGTVVAADLLFTSLGVIAGGIVGAGLLKKMSSVPLTVIFSIVMAVAGIKMLLF